MVITEPHLTQHSWLRSVFLHLAPGILTGAGYFILAPLVAQAGYPTVMALILSGIFTMLPFELGYLYYLKKKTGKKLFGEIIVYLQPLKIWEYIVWVAGAFVLSGMIFTLVAHVGTYLQGLFDWLPESMIMDGGLSGEYTREKLILTYALFLVFVVVVLPLTEELYFRGYLLPRLPVGSKAVSGFIHSALFALYHIWTPWMFITRTFGVLPMIYAVQIKRNIYIGIITHCLLNSVDFIVATIFIVSLF